MPVPSNPLIGFFDKPKKKTGKGAGMDPTRLLLQARQRVVTPVSDEEFKKMQAYNEQKIKFKPPHGQGTTLGGGTGVTPGSFNDWLTTDMRRRSFVPERVANITKKFPLLPNYDKGGDKSYTTWYGQANRADGQPTWYNPVAIIDSLARGVAQRKIPAGEALRTVATPRNWKPVLIFPENSKRKNSGFRLKGAAESLMWKYDPLPVFRRDGNPTNQL